MSERAPEAAGGGAGESAPKPKAPRKRVDPKKRVGRTGKTADGTARPVASGTAARPPVNCADVAEQYGLYWQSGGNFYMRPPGTDRWMPLNDNRMDMFLKGMGLSKGNPMNPTGEVEAMKMWVMVNRPVDLVMNLAGYFPGLVTTPDGLKLLIPEGPRLVDPVAGEWPLIAAIMEQLFVLPVDSPDMPPSFVLQGDRGRSRDVWSWLCQPVLPLPPEGPAPHVYDQRDVVYSWLRQWLEIITLRAAGKNVKRSAPAMIVAGPKNSGKSLLTEYIIKPLMGNRVSDPSQFLAKDTTFNPDLYRAELAAMDDSPLGTDYESRRKMSEFLKQYVAGTVHRFHPKGKDAIVVPAPVRRLMWAINDDKQNLMQLPLMNDSTMDKMTIVHVKKATLPMPTRTLEEYTAFGDALAAEVPAFAHWLLHEFQIPEVLKGGRFGIEAVHAPDLMEELFEDSAHGGLLELVDAARWNSPADGRIDLWQWLAREEDENCGRIEGDMWIGTHLELKALLEHTDCNVAVEAKNFFKRARVDFLLSELRKKSERITRPEGYRHKVKGVVRREWCIQRPGQ